MQTERLRQLGLAVGSAFLLTALAGCEARSEEEAGAPTPAPEVEVVEVKAEEVVLWGSFTGRIAAPQTVDLRPRVSGYIEKINFVEGDLVQEGDLLFQIDPRPYRAREQLAEAELARADSQLKLAESEAGRAENLWQRRAISREEFEQRTAALTAARAAVDAASANLASAQLELEYTQVTAPISGRIGRAEVTRGNLATADTTTLANLVSVDPLYVYFEGDQTSVPAGSFEANAKVPVRVTLQDQSQGYTAGHLDFIDNRFDGNTGTLQFRALVENPRGRFKPGQFARVEMPVSHASNAVLVDDKAVLTDQDRRYVYRLQADNTVTRQYVELGRQSNGSRVITAGLQEGDKIVVNGLQRIAFPGMQVSPQTVASPSAHKVPTLADNRH